MKKSNNVLALFVSIAILSFNINRASAEDPALCKMASTTLSIATLYGAGFGLRDHFTKGLVPVDQRAGDSHHFFTDYKRLHSGDAILTAEEATARFGPKAVRAANFYYDHENHLAFAFPFVGIGAGLSFCAGVDKYSTSKVSNQHAKSFTSPQETKHTNTPGTGTPN